MTSQDISLTRPQVSRTKVLWQRFSRNRAAVLGLILFIAVVLIALLLMSLRPATRCGAQAIRSSGHSSMLQRRLVPTSLGAISWQASSMARAFRF